MKKVLLFSLLIVIYFSFYLWVNAKINFTVSPIKYEIEALTWTTITKTATLYNNSEGTYTIITWKSDFTTNWINWVPKIIRKSELVYPDQQLSNWINIETESFIIWPWEEKTINFNIDIPDDATPGGHYWAIFFKKQNSNEEFTTEVWINLDYWVLILVNVDWEVITSWEPEEITIINNSWWPSLTVDNCPYWDLSISNFDGKCIDDIFSSEKEIVDTNFDDIDFDIIFDIPFKNDWNTHIKPKWQIILIDEDGNELKQIWKEIIKNSKWAIVWEKIVDYLPVNDIWWNVLPNSKRKFESNWKWFPYKWFDDDWNEIIKYWKPWEYYTKKNVEDRWFLMFWERVCERTKYKKITAIIDLSYENREWEDVEFNSAKEFEVTYKENYIWINPYVIISGILIILIILFIYLIILLRKQKCKKCKKRFSRKYKACPYCWKKVKKNKK